MIFKNTDQTKTIFRVCFSEISSYMTSNERTETLLKELIEQQDRLREEAKKKEKKQDNAAGAVATAEAVTLPVPTAEIRVPGGDLYYNTKDYLRQRLQEIADVRDSELDVRCILQLL